jgi:hypothetical protein
MMGDIYIQEFLAIICTGVDIHPYGLNCTSSLKFTVMLEIEKSGHTKTREARSALFHYLFMN